MIHPGKRKIFIIWIGLLLNFIFILTATGQHKNYLGTHKISKIRFKSFDSESRVKNVILMIGDGMGTSHVYAGMMANKGELYLDNFPYAGFMKVYSASDAITDSGASATAMATGAKTINGFIGIDRFEKEQVNIIEIAESEGLSTGLVATASITHATPAAFVAHVLSRDYYEMIASQMVNSGIDVFIGGGQKNFLVRMDSKNLLVDLMKKDYKVAMNLSDLEKVHSGKLAGLLYPNHPPSIPDGRGDMLIKATQKAIEILSQNENGFFLMIEASQIDWASHSNDLDCIVEEMLDFDMAIGEVLEFAAENRETLVIVTADHETGGLGLTGGDINKGEVEGGFVSKGHTAVMVPVFSFGPQAEEFSGILDNTDIFEKINRLLFKN